eukprot:GHVU01024330.1.p1 GENE.GHVU01024330.1~~GHVU01024330.1.p1  ORF type:complete len:103 (-),score=8.10 GHVU01024330.1:111-419(-)
MAEEMIGIVTIMRGVLPEDEVESSHTSLSPTRPTADVEVRLSGPFIGGFQATAIAEDSSSTMSSSVAVGREHSHPYFWVIADSSPASACWCEGRLWWAARAC